MTKYTKYCEDCGVKTMSFSPNEYGWLDGLCDDCNLGRELAKELVHPDQELTLDELERDMSAYIELTDHIEHEFGGDIDKERVGQIIKHAFVIARDN